LEDVIEKFNIHRNGIQHILLLGSREDMILKQCKWR